MIKNSIIQTANPNYINTLDWTAQQTGMACKVLSRHVHNQCMEMISKKNLNVWHKTIKNMPPLNCILMIVLGKSLTISHKALHGS